MFYPAHVFSADEEAEIVAAIRRFELRTSGEIRVHVEHRLRRPPEDEAVRVFGSLSMQHTAERNGVLFLLAPGQRAFAVYGDEGIDAVTPDDFWTRTCEAMQPHFAAGEFVTGLTTGITIAGEAMATYFPYRDGDVNELPDDISYA